MEVALEARLAIEALNARYVDCLDQGRFEEWPDFFTENGGYKIISAENHGQGLPLGVIDCRGRAMMRDRITALRDANIYEEHRYRRILSTPLVREIGEGAIRAETPYQVTRIMRDGSAMLFSVGRYLDRLVTEDGQLRLAERFAVFDNKRIDTLLVIPL